MMCARQYITVFLCLATALRASAQIQNVGWWNNSVFYQIYPRSFMDGKGDDGIGDLKGITSKLDHFVDIGVRGIWLSPIYNSPMKDFGYDISDFLNIHPDFGTIDDLVELVNQARKRDLKVILDLVPNHTSDQHDWFQKSIQKQGKYTDYYIWADPIKEGNQIQPPNNWLSVFGGSAWTYNKVRNQYYFHQFLSEQPDLNYRNRHVQLEMEHVIEYWLELGIDGFRIDAVPHLYEEEDIKKNEPNSNVTNADPNNHDSLDHIYTKDQNETYTLIQKWRNVVDSYAYKHKEDEKVIMTEAYTTLNNTFKYYEVGSHIPFNFKFITEVNSTHDAASFKKIIDEWIDYMPEGNVPNWVMGNHDNKRTATRYPGRGDQMTMLAMILPGVAVTYYGEEIGMEDNDKITWEQTKDTQACKAGQNKFAEVSRDPCRTPFQWNANKNAGFSNTTKGTWLPIPENYISLNLEQQQADKGSHYKVYKALTSLRNSSMAVKTGSYKSQVVESVLVVTRTSDTELVTLGINFSDNEQTIDVKTLVANDKNLDKTKVLIASVGSNLPTGQEQQNHNVKIPAKASIILQSTYKYEPSSVSETRSDSVLTILLVWIIAMALRS